MSKILEKPLWALGLMSGTSADGIDAALIQTDGMTITAFGPTHYEPYSGLIRQKILKAYGHPPGPETSELDRLITERHAEVVFALLQKAGLKATDVDLIGFHGQTLFHQPPLKGEIGKTHSIGDGQYLASLTRIPVIDQFRLKDMAQGGQGAPLVPVFHQALARKFDKPIAIVNIGGVANVTWIGGHESDLIGFDAGPGNGLMDDWIRKHTDLLWDEDGKNAAKGAVEESLLSKWLSHPYFSRKPPKALDRHAFKICLDEVKELSLENALATLTAFTAASIEKSLDHFPLKPTQWLIAGGGAHNPVLLNMLTSRLQAHVQKAAEWGWDGDGLEAQAFGYLAVRSLRGLPLTFPGTTGVPFPLSGGRVCKVS